MAIISFDQAVEYYDETRGYREGTAEQIRDALVTLVGATAETRFLELGVGTGRIALPFIRAGYDYTGVDISAAMMARLTAKLEADPQPHSYRYRLHQANVLQLPYPNGSFDVILAVHVFHLINDWQAGIDEARRVLKKPGGWLLLAQDDSTDQSDGPDNFMPGRVVRQKWDEIMQSLGISGQQRGQGRWDRREEILTYLSQNWVEAQEITLLEYQLPPLSARQMADRIRARMYSSDWATPDEIFQQADHQLAEWVNTECPHPDLPVISGSQFKVIVARLPAA